MLSDTKCLATSEIHKQHWCSFRACCLFTNIFRHDFMISFEHCIGSNDVSLRPGEGWRQRPVPCERSVVLWSQKSLTSRVWNYQDLLPVCPANLNRDRAALLDFANLLIGPNGTNSESAMSHFRGFVMQTKHCCPYYRCILHNVSLWVKVFLGHAML